MTDIAGGEAGLVPLETLLGRLPVSPEVPTRSDEPDEAMPPASGPLRAHLAAPMELADWDSHAVASPNGHVYQSRAWADERATAGWHPWHIVFDDGFRLLALGHPRGPAAAPAYASRGPLPETDPARSAERAALAAELLGAEGVPALIVDGETPAETGLGQHLAKAGFVPVDEEQPARHRMDLHLGPADAPNSDEKTIFGSFGANTRNLIRQAERHGLKVRRLDAGGGRIEEEEVATELEEFERVDLQDAEAVDAMLRTFHGMLEPLDRRPSAVASDGDLVGWSRRAIAAGHLLHLQAEHAQDGPIAGASFYRHGHRLTYWLAGERADLRRAYPGAARLLIWRGIQVALDERRTVVDLGGVDTAASRGLPNKGDPTYGAYQLRESFGARWVELAGAHRKTMRPRSIDVGRVVAAAWRRLGRLAQ